MRPATRSASASARRPSRPVTSGGRPSRTAPRKSVSSRASGSSRGDVELAALDPRLVAGAADEPVHLDLLRRVVDRQVGVGLEEADLPDAVAADPARREVGDAAVLEPQPRVGDVDAPGQHRHADRLDRRDLRPHERQDDVEVVDHQVEDDVDVEAALGERAEPVHLDEPRVAAGAATRRPTAGLNRSVWPTASTAPPRRGRRDQAVGFLDRPRQRLLDEHRDAPLEERHGDRREMRLGRHGDRHRVHLRRSARRRR